MCVTLIGLIGAAASTGMPMWRVTAFIGENIIVMETRYEGLWMNCYRQANIRMQCKVYDSLLALPTGLCICVFFCLLFECHFYKGFFFFFCK
ncbi:hypothetical protein PO909_003520 [Leuciscus waleckii]